MTINPFVIYFSIIIPTLYLFLLGIILEEKTREKRIKEYLKQEKQQFIQHIIRNSQKKG